jgi:hypothetical protein
MVVLGVNTPGRVLDEGVLDGGAFFCQHGAESG